MANRKLNTPYGQMYRKFISQDDEVFTLLVWCGLPMTDAYRYAFGSKGCNNSIASMASRKAREKQIKNYFAILKQGAECNWGAFDFKYVLDENERYDEDYKN